MQSANIKHSRKRCSGKGFSSPMESTRLQHPQRKIFVSTWLYRLLEASCWSYSLWACLAYPECLIKLLRFKSTSQKWGICDEISLLVPSRFIFNISNTCLNILFKDGTEVSAQLPIMLYFSSVVTVTVAPSWNPHFKIGHISKR